MQQRLRIVERGLNVLFSVGDCLCADVLGPGANALTALLHRPRGGLRSSHKLFKSPARLFEAGFSHGSHFLWNLKTVTRFFVHVPLSLCPIVVRRASLPAVPCPSAHKPKTCSTSGPDHRKGPLEVLQATPESPPKFI